MCPNIGQQIRYCQKKRKIVLISLGGAEGVNGFNTSAEAKAFATTIWNMFLGGSSKLRPFDTAVLDGIDLNIENGSPKYYSDFVQSLRALMSVDTTKRYFLTGAPQCPFPDPYMGPITKGSVLGDMAKEFDFLYVQFYNNPCYLGAVEFTTTLNLWLNFAIQTKVNYGKSPLIFIGLPSHPRASINAKYYQNPDQVEAVYKVFFLFFMTTLEM